MRHYPDSAMIFAAGRGTPMGALTKETPRRHSPVAESALLDHPLQHVREAKIRHCVVDTHHLGEQIAAHLAGQGDITLSVAATLSETSSDLCLAVLNSDAVWRGANAFDVLRDAWRPGMGVLLVLVLVHKQHAQGHDGTGCFTADSDSWQSTPGPLIHTGAQLIDPNLLPKRDIVAFSIGEDWQALGAKGLLFGCHDPGHWGDAGSGQALPAVAAMMARANV